MDFNANAMQAVYELNPHIDVRDLKSFKWKRLNVFDRPELAEMDLSQYELIQMSDAQRNTQRCRGRRSDHL